MVNHAYLAKMKLVKQQQRQMQTKQEHRRLKVITKLEEQLAMVNALLRNERYVPTKIKWVTNAQGVRESVVVPKRVRSWFWMNAAGCFFNVMYGSRMLPLKEGLTAISVAKRDDIPEVIHNLIEAVKAGELDEAIDSVAERGTSHFRSNPPALPKAQIKAAK